MAMVVDEKARWLNEFGRERLPGLLGLEILSCSAERVTGRVPITPPLIAGTGFLWAPVVIALADTLCAYGAGEARPKESQSFTTAELKTNFLGTAKAGDVIYGEATPIHLGRTTQVWDATITNEATQRRIAVFRCTQLILYPR
jgi:1,4-dihydroxy-2-naphthoyl-CoA hydrolase